MENVLGLNFVGIFNFLLLWCFTRDKTMLVFSHLTNKQEIVNP